MDEKESFTLTKKSDLIKLNINEFRSTIPNLKNCCESKAIVVANWLAGWIEQSLKTGKAQISNILPTKAEFAYLLGVSVGTIQHAIRHLEDLGFVESKQCIGTMIKDYTKPVSIKKLTSKRDLAINAIKNYILNDGFKVGSYLPSSRTIATIIGYSNNTTRLAIDALVAENIIKRRFKNAKDNGWIILTLDFSLANNSNVHSETLVDRTVKDLEKLIATEMKIGDKIPSHKELSDKLKVSLKTTHDALQVLIQKGYLLARRGTYGTTVIKIPGTTNKSSKMEDKIFASAKDAAFYHYEKTQNYLKRLIAQNYEIGEKIPSILTLARELDLSPNTIRTALQHLAKEGYLVFSRGRYGGTFVIDIPEIESQTFKWLAVNPSFANEMQNAEHN